MSAAVIEQAFYAIRGSDGYHLLARSPGFLEEWLAEGQRLCAGFGERPPGVRCPLSVFAQPFGKDNVAVVQVADQGTDDTGQPGPLGFRLLVFVRRFYERWVGDPFLVDDRFPMTWRISEGLHALYWPEEPLALRRVEDLSKVIRPLADDQDAMVSQAATLLGGVQGLVDGGRLVFERSAPDPSLVRHLWLLLPASLRGQLWPASFAFGNALGFHVVVVPRAGGDQFNGYITEEQAGDYPEGYYELNLQQAVATNDQHRLNHLFARRGTKQTWRLGLILLGVIILLVFAMKLLNATIFFAP
jgi:hypothetical protein